MPTVLRIGSYRFFFFSNEGYGKPHIHVESGDTYAKYWLRPVSLAKSFEYKPVELSKIRRLVESNEDFFWEKWHEYFA